MKEIVFDTMLSFETLINNRHINVDGMEDCANIIVKGDADLMHQVVYSLDRKRGSVENIYFRNVEILNGNFPVSIIRGFEMHTEMSRPRNIYFDNVVVLGKQVESPSDLHMVVELSDDILFNGTAHAKRNPF